MKPFCRSEFARILTLCRQGKAAALEFEADGTRLIRGFCPPERLILLGGGHIAQPLCHFAAELGFAVTVVDDRPSFANRARFPQAAGILCAGYPQAIQTLRIQSQDYVAVITRGHRHDTDCLRAILPGTMPRYLGMIGSRGRIREQMDLLEEEGFPRERLRQVRAPIGLDIGALTIQEIAVSIAAQLVQARRAGTDRRAGKSVLTEDEVHIPLLEFLAEDPSPKALLLVCASSGSTPAKPGALMAVDRNARAMGTIGGGSGENAAMLEAYRLIGTGRACTVGLDLTGDVAEDEGMVCGGHMKVLIADVEEC